MQNYCKKHDIAIWLPNGNDIGVGDSCVKSPALKPCRPNASLQRTPHRYQPHILAVHQPHGQRRPNIAWAGVRLVVAKIPAFGFV